MKESFPAWWKEVNVEVFGWTPQKGDIYVNSKQMPAHLEQKSGAFSFVSEDSGKRIVVDIQ